MADRNISHGSIVRTGSVVFVFAMIVGLAGLPAWGAAIPIDQKGYQDVQNLAQVALAMHNFEAVNGTLPPQYLQSGGSPTLSWRVAILPYLGYSQLYGAFDPTKAWDDPANLPLLQQMPAVFRGAADAAGGTTTRYEVGTGANLIFNGATGTRLSAITDGTSNTLLVGEAAAGVPWTAPQDLPVGPNPTLGGTGFAGVTTPGYVPFALADGSVRFLSDTIDSMTLSHLFQRNDGAAIDPSATYDYVVVPEPAAVALMGLGLVALSAAPRAPGFYPTRRRSHSMGPLFQR